jgi:lysozyme
MRRRRRHQITAGLLTLTVLVGCTETRRIAQFQENAPPVAVVSAGFTAHIELPAVPVPAPKPDERPASAWRTNEEAVKIIRDAEGLRLNAYYLAGQWLIGYGHATGATAEEAASLTITESEAEALLRADIEICEAAVRRMVNVRVTQNKFSALVAFCYNVGPGTLANSSILRHINAGDEVRAADAFLLYDKARIETEKRQVARLTERRIRERFLFLAS